MSYIHVKDEDQAARLASDLSGTPRFALDCEAAGFHRYTDGLCLMQVTTPRATYVVDPLTVDCAALFRGPLEDPGVEIVMHGSDYDLRLLDRDLDIRLKEQSRSRLMICPSSSRTRPTLLCLTEAGSP